MRWATPTNLRAPTIDPHIGGDGIRSSKTLCQGLDQLLEGPVPGMNYVHLQTAYTQGSLCAPSPLHPKSIMLHSMQGKKRGRAAFTRITHPPCTTCMADAPHACKAHAHLGCAHIISGQKVNVPAFPAAATCQNP